MLSAWKRCAKCLGCGRLFRPPWHLVCAENTGRTSGLEFWLGHLSKPSSTEQIPRLHFLYSVRKQRHLPHACDGACQTSGNLEQDRRSQLVVGTQKVLSKCPEQQKGGWWLMLLHVWKGLKHPTSERLVHAHGTCARGKDRRQMLLTQRSQTNAVSGPTVCSDRRGAQESAPTQAVHIGR